MQRLDWLQHDTTSLKNFDEAAQHAAVQAATMSGIGRDEALAVIRLLVLEGKPAGRRAAVAALSDFQGADANQLVLQPSKIKTRTFARRPSSSCAIAACRARWPR